MWIQEWIDERFGVPNTVNIQVFEDFAKEVEQQERRRIAYKLGEDIYNNVCSLRARLEEHGWSGQQTRYDSAFIARINKALLSIGNDLYTFRQALKGESNE